MKFCKPAKTVDEQIDILRERGMVIDDADSARHYLSHINYYRLTGYWLRFEETHKPHQFKAGTRFDDVLDVYIFDREFRLLLLDAIERIEVSVRTQWAYQTAHRGGSHAYLQPDFVGSRSRRDNEVQKLLVDVRASKEPFIKHYINRYSDPELPPSWSVSEIMSLGQLSRWYQLLRPFSLRRKISDVYGLDQKVLASLLHHLTYVRNLCAHHSRVWSRQLTITPPKVRSKPKVLVHAMRADDKSYIYNTCCFILHMMNVIAPSHHWHERLFDLLERHSIDVTEMGFPSGWKTLELWKRFPAP